MEIEKIEHARDEYHALQAQSSKIHEEIQALYSFTTSAGNIITKEVEDAQNKINSLFNKKSKLDRNCRLISLAISGYILEGKELNYKGKLQ